MGVKKISSKITLLLVCLLGLTVASFASHIKGGWIGYRYLGKDASGNARYELLVKIFRNCDLTSGPNDPRVNITIFRNGDTSQVGVFVAPLFRNNSLVKVDFNPCLNPKPKVCYIIQEYKVEVSLPISVQGYTATFQRCCRVGGIRNIVPPSQSIGNTYTIQLPGTQRSPNHIENESPVFVEKDTVALCASSPFELDFSAIDADGDSLEYELAPALTGGRPSDLVPVPSSPPPYAPIPYSNPYSYDNPFGNIINIDSKTGIITGISPSITGEYVLAALAKEYRNGILIGEIRKELHVNVARCAVPDAELAAQKINCDDYKISFENQSPSSAINSYYWDFGAPTSPNNISTLPKPTFTYPDTGTYIAKLVVNRGDACSDSATMQVKIYPGFKPGFISVGDCFNNPVVFQDTTKPASGSVTSWFWDFGNTNATNDTSRLKNPAYKFPAAGTYQISLRTISNKGCDKTITVPLLVKDVSLLTLPFKDTLICGRDSVQLRANGTGNFTWTPNDGSISNRQTATPTVFPTKTTTYKVILDDKGCTNEDSVKVNVLENVNVNAGRDTSICTGDQVMLNATSATTGLSFQWNPAATLNNPNIVNPIAQPVAPLTPYVVIASFGNCKATDTVNVRTVPYPISTAGPNQNICLGDVVILRGSGDGNRFQWLPTAGLSSPNSAVTNAKPTQTTTYTLHVYDNKGCTKPGISNVTVNVLPAIIVNAGNDTTVLIGQSLELSAESNATINTWSPALGLSTTSGLKTVLKLNANSLPPNTNFITYRITGSTPNGCNASDDIVIRIFSTGPSIFVPNAFTPNKDGLNDRIRPILAGIQQMEFFRIFNRYGQLVFETNEPETGWDGNLKGKPQGSANFVYQVQAIDLDGNVIKQSGSFVLIR
jgi:gliding motility-associated-like protein